MLVLCVCEELEAAGVTFKKKPNEGRMKGLAFAYDPDGCASQTDHRFLSFFPLLLIAPIGVYTFHGRSRQCLLYQGKVKKIFRKSK